MVHRFGETTETQLHKLNRTESLNLNSENLRFSVLRHQTEGLVGCTKEFQTNVYGPYDTQRNDLSLKELFVLVRLLKKEGIRNGVPATNDLYKGYLRDVIPVAIQFPMPPMCGTRHVSNEIPEGSNRFLCSTPKESYSRQ